MLINIWISTLSICSIPIKANNHTVQYSSLVTRHNNILILYKRYEMPGVRSMLKKTWKLMLRIETIRNCSITIADIAPVPVISIHLSGKRRPKTYRVLETQERQWKSCDNVLQKIDYQWNLQPVPSRPLVFLQPIARRKPLLHSYLYRSSYNFSMSVTNQLLWLFHQQENTFIINLNILNSSHLYKLYIINIFANFKEF